MELALFYSSLEGEHPTAQPLRGSVSPHCLRPLQRRGGGLVSDVPEVVLNEARPVPMNIG